MQVGEVEEAKRHRGLGAPGGLAERQFEFTPYQAAPSPVNRGRLWGVGQFEEIVALPG